jgi:hypothetical protein
MKYSDSFCAFHPCRFFFKSSFWNAIYEYEVKLIQALHYMIPVKQVLMIGYRIRYLSIKNRIYSTRILEL